MATYRTPGVYREDVFPAPAAELRTGVPVFLGLASKGDVNTPKMLTLWPQFAEEFDGPLAGSYLSYAVAGFFQNGGDLCYVVRLTDASLTALQTGLAAIEALDAADLVCAPDIVCLGVETSGSAPALSGDRLEIQAMQAVLATCKARGDCLAILDALPGLAVQEVQLQCRWLDDANAALYYPWVRSTRGFVPPCGHVAGVYATTDRRVGVHKAPANEMLEGILDLETILTDAQQGTLNLAGINCLRAFPGRGIRVWGARTLSSDPNWTYINIRRLFLTASRWIERNMAWAAFEPHDSKLWARISRQLTAYFGGLFQRGALRGASAQEAYYVKCNAETNPPAVRDAGQVVTEIGLAPAAPGEFIVIRITHGPGGITVEA